MDGVSLDLLFIALVILIILSAFFSSSETSMVSLNRYRLRHLAKKNHRGAIRASKLLDRPDRLIGVILIGNNLVNIWATSIVTLISVRLYGDAGLAIGTGLLTLVLLIFAEVTPKTVAALHPEKIAFPASFLLKPLLTLFYPFVLLVNVVSNFLCKTLFGIDASKKNRLADHLHPDELRTVVDEAGDLIPDQHQGMLLNVLDLDQATVEDIMIPRNETTGIDLEHDMPTILKQIRSSDYTRLPVYEGDINNIIGILHLRHAARFLQGDDALITHDAIRQNMLTPYFVPESTPLHTQLLNFKKEKKRLAVVVDEYGEVQGIATLVDLLEEIVGDFSSDKGDNANDAVSQIDDDWYLIDATASVRDVNRNLGWNLPTNGPKTINGIIVEYLESIPEGNCSFELEDYRFEVTKLNGKRIERTLARDMRQ